MSRWGNYHLHPAGRHPLFPFSDAGSLRSLAEDAQSTIEAFIERQHLSTCTDIALHCRLHEPILLLSEYRLIIAEQHMLLKFAVEKDIHKSISLGNDRSKWGHSGRARGSGLDQGFHFGPQVFHVSCCATAHPYIHNSFINALHLNTHKRCQANSTQGVTHLVWPHQSPESHFQNSLES